MLEYPEKLLDIGAAVMCAAAALRTEEVPLLTQRSAKFLPVALALVMVSALSVSAGTKVRIDYDRTADFESYKTFAWKKTPETSLRQASNLMHSRIMNAIEYQLTSSGQLAEVEEDADLEVTYHTNTRDEVRVDTSYYGYGWGPGVYHDPYWMGYWGPTYGATSSTYNYTVGTLVLDIIDAKENKLIFRGTAEGTVSNNPEKSEKKIYKALKKMSKEFQKMRKRDKKGK